MPRVKVWVWWLSVSFVFALLLMRTDSEVARGLPAIAALGIWFAHVALGLGAAIASTRLLGSMRWTVARSPALQLLAGGLMGSLAFAPLSLGLEALFPAPAEDVVDGGLDALEQAGGALALAAEWLQLAPAYLASWAILNAPPALAARVPRYAALVSASSGDGSDGEDVSGQGPNGPAMPRTEPVSSSAHVPAGVPVTDVARPATAPPAADSVEVEAALSKPLLARVPRSIGVNLLMAQSDLHYLHLRTTLGTATLLGTISELETEMGDRGLRVHRSYWVAVDHVRRVRRTASGWHCVLSDQTKVPVSRRRLAAVKERLGVDFVRDVQADGG
ncbi:MAG: LytTR family DNA-binding domain-containing protein [Lysobacterales bacterium]|jgi:hypothetical protein